MPPPTELKASGSFVSATPLIEPWDEFNQQLVAQVHPPDWRNPEPAACYNLVVIGAGPAGLVTAAGAASLGARVALIEKHLMGGDCLNVGCVPSKTLIRAAHAAHEMRNAQRFGIRASEVAVDFDAVMERVRAIRARLSPHDSARRFRELGVDVFLGPARFAGPDRVDVNGATLRFKSAVICTGARATRPDVAGLSEVGFLTNESIFNLLSLPRRLVVLGGGPVGCELAQAFQRLGARVTILHNKPRLLDREDADAAALLQQSLSGEGVHVIAPGTVVRAERADDGKRLHYEANGRHASLVVDEILAAAGRVPNVEDLDLEAANVAYDPRRGVTVDDRLRTSNPRVFAAGDVCMQWKFTHAADFAARLVIQNALFLGRKKLSALTIPRCTYTDPEIAQVGISEQEAAERGLAHRTFVQPLSGIDRAITDATSEGFVKIHVRAGRDEILGATVVAPHAGDMIGELAVAMAARIGLARLAQVIHPYPTLAEAIRKCGDAYNRTRLTPAVQRWLERWLKWNR